MAGRDPKVSTIDQAIALGGKFTGLELQIVKLIKTGTHAGARGEDVDYASYRVRDRNDVEARLNWNWVMYPANPGRELQPGEYVEVWDGNWSTKNQAIAAGGGMTQNGIPGGITPLGTDTPAGWDDEPSEPPIIPPDDDRMAHRMAQMEMRVTDLEDIRDDLRAALKAVMG